MDYVIHIQTEFDKIVNGNKVFREMIAAELANHEACITYTAADALSALGLSFDKLTKEQKLIIEELTKQINSCND